MGEVKKKRFIIVQADSIKELERMIEVNVYNGYVCHGPITYRFVQNRNRTWSSVDGWDRYYQPMTLAE